MRRKEAVDIAPATRAPQRAPIQAQRRGAVQLQGGGGDGSGAVGKVALGWRPEAHTESILLQIYVLGMQAAAGAPGGASAAMELRDALRSGIDSACGEVAGKQRKQWEATVATTEGVNREWTVNIRFVHGEPRCVETNLDGSVSGGTGLGSSSADEDGNGQRGGLSINAGKDEAGITGEVEADQQHTHSHTREATSSTTLTSGTAIATFDVPVTAEIEVSCDVDMNASDLLLGPFAAVKAGRAIGEAMVEAVTSPKKEKAFVGTYRYNDTVTRAEAEALNSKLGKTGG